MRDLENEDVRLLERRLEITRRLKERFIREEAKLLRLIKQKQLATS